MAREPPPFMANAILNFHFVFWSLSLIWTFLEQQIWKRVFWFLWGNSRDWGLGKKVSDTRLKAHRVQKHPQGILRNYFSKDIFHCISPWKWKWRSIIETTLLDSLSSNCLMVVSASSKFFTSSCCLPAILPTMSWCSFSRAVTMSWCCFFNFDVFSFWSLSSFVTILWCSFSNSCICIFLWVFWKKNLLRILAPLKIKKKWINHWIFDDI